MGTSCFASVPDWANSGIDRRRGVLASECDGSRGEGAGRGESRRCAGADAQAGRTKAAAATGRDGSAATGRVDANDDAHAHRRGCHAAATGRRSAAAAARRGDSTATRRRRRAATCRRTARGRATDWGGTAMEARRRRDRVRTARQRHHQYGGIHSSPPAWFISSTTGPKNPLPASPGVLSMGPSRPHRTSDKNARRTLILSPWNTSLPRSAG